MPEPLWWERARELKAKGLSPAAIGRICGGYERTSVLYATDPEYRERHREQNRRRGKRGGAYRDKSRRELLRYARDEAAATGEHIDRILQRLGEPVRRRYKEARA